MAQVLVVDDDPLVGAIAIVFLREAGHAAHWAGSCKEAMRLLRFNRPDVALVAQEMPATATDGAALIAAFRASACLGYFPALLMTMIDTPHNRTIAAQAGAAGWVAKPLLRTPLFAEVERVTNGKSEPAAKAWRDRQ